MSAGLIFSGILLGALAGFVGLISGMPIWTAFLIYSGFGALCVLTGAMILAVRSGGKATPQRALPIAQPDR